jgi:hypothetical protein
MRSRDEQVRKKVFEMVEQKEEKDVTPIEIPNKLIRKIRQANNDYKLIPTKDVAIIALNHFLYDLTHPRSDLPSQFSIEKKKEP